MPPMAVEIVTLEAKPVEQLTEFVGTIKSRRSTTIQPQVEGFITRIRVKSGDRVGAGATLMEIDSRVQQASLQSLESVRAQREIDVTYARQEAERAAKLLKAGAASQMDADRATNALQGRRSPAADARRAATHVENRPCVLPGDLSHGGHRRRHSGSRRRSRHESDAVDDGRCECGARGLHQRAGAAGAEAEAGLDGSSLDETGQPARRRKDQFHLAVC